MHTFSSVSYMKYTIKIRQRNVPDEVLLSDLRKSARKRGKNYIGYDDYENAGRFHPATLCKRFGSWNEALVKAGLKVKKQWMIPEDKMLAELKRVWDSLGRQPHSNEMNAPVSRFSYNTYARRFGSWGGTLLAFAKTVKKGKLIATGKGNKKKVRKLNLHANKSIRFDVLKRDNYKCRLCGASPATDSKITLHVDHIIPVSKGGETILQNLQTLCSDCNLGKAAKSINNEQ